MQFKYTVIFILLISACKKETVQAPYLYNEITSFAVVPEGSDTLLAAVNNGDIILYWPSSASIPDSITPKISASDKATVKPASGQKIALKDGVTYTVTSESGSVATYTLHLNVNQADILLNEKADVQASLGSVLSLSGLYNVITDTAKTSVYLLSKAGTEKRLNINKIGFEGYANNIQADLPVEGLDTGWYKVKINSGARTVTSSRSFIYVAPGVPELILMDAFTLKKGDTYTLPGKFLHDVTMAVGRFAGGYDEYAFEIVSYSSTGVVIKATADFPVGSYSKVFIGYLNADGSESYSDIPQAFTITE